MIRRNNEMLKRIALGMVLTLLLLGMLTITPKANSASVAAVSSHPGAYYKVDPENITIGPEPAINDTFEIELRLLNATLVNIPAGVAGVEVHFVWNSTLIQPVNFTDRVGTSGGVLNLPVLFGITPQFYNETGTNRIVVPPEQAKCYLVAAATTGTYWSGDGTIAEIFFKVIYQPQPGEPDIHDVLNFTLTDLVDGDANVIPHEYEYGNYTVIIPEFSPTAILLLLTLFTFVAVALRKTKLYKKV
jgi:hypothetical protein